MSSELTWQLIRKHNCFIKKRRNVTFSSEPNNLTNKHAFKWSGLANAKAVGVDFNRDANGVVIKGCVLSIKARKASLRRKPAKTWNNITMTGDFQRVAKTIKGQTEGNFYRRDLTSAALARWTQINKTTLA